MTLNSITATNATRDTHESSKNITLWKDEIHSRAICPSEPPGSLKGDEALNLEQGILSRLLRSLRL